VGEKIEVLTPKFGPYIVNIPIYDPMTPQKNKEAKISRHFIKMRVISWRLFI
jgi:hypothetical protein